MKLQRGYEACFTLPAYQDSQRVQECNQNMEQGEKKIVWQRNDAFYKYFLSVLKIAYLSNINLRSGGPSLAERNLINKVEAYRGFN